MQLDLFVDNRQNILLNIADEDLRAGEFEKAIAVCQQVIDDYPGNRQASELRMLIQTWHNMLVGISSSSCQPGQLKEMLDSLQSVSQPSLKGAVLNELLELLKIFPEPDHVFVPPRFHRGLILLELGKYADAAQSFRNAINPPNPETGRFMAWYADAMTLTGKADDAIPVYLQAFLEDPATVDIDFVKHPEIRQLHQHCSFQADGIEDDGVVPWLPVWGWLQGVFPLPLQNPPILSDLEEKLDDNTLPVPRLWFDLLTIAEQLRTVQRDDRQMASVRRLMKQLNEDMFECYMQKIRGVKQ